jgi:Transposase, Mutator family
VLGVKVATSETKQAWNTFFADLVARGLAGVRLVTSDAHARLVEAIAASLPGASWQRCRIPLRAFGQDRVVGGVPGDSEALGDPGDAQVLAHDPLQRPPQAPARQPRPRLGRG